MIISKALREKAHGYELNSAAAKERGDLPAAISFQTIAITLLDLAETFEQAELEEAA